MKKIFLLIISLSMFSSCVKISTVSSSTQTSSNDTKISTVFSSEVVETNHSSSMQISSKKIIITDSQENIPNNVSFFYAATSEGFISPDGAEIDLSAYGYYGDFYNDRLVVFKENDKNEINVYTPWDIAILDLYGNIVVDFGTYRSTNLYLHYQNEGLIVLLNDGNMAVINKDGEYILPPDYRTIEENLQYNRRSVQKRENEINQMGYINENYQVVISPKFDLVLPFNSLNGKTFAYVFPEHISIYQSNDYYGGSGPQYIFNYQVINSNGTILKSEEKLIYCNFETYKKFEQMTEKDFEYPVFDEQTLTKQWVDLNGKWSSNPNYSIYNTTITEIPEQLIQFSNTPQLEVYYWSDTTKYERKSITELLK